MTLAKGACLGPYTILDLIGSGGMGEVYRAIDTRLQRTVALKILPSHVAGSPTRRQRWDREARAVSSLSHPHICPLYDVGEQDGVPFLVMEHLEGETLAHRLGRGALPVKDLLRYAIEIAAALDHAHRQGIVHRDLKPANIMLTRTGAKLLDFGLAQLLAPEPVITGSPIAARSTETEALTEEGTILGTLQYMAPEQLEAKDTDARTDIFAFGAVVYEMATGRPAFEGGSKASVIAAILTLELPPLSAARASRERGTGSSAEMTPPLLDQVIKRCLAKLPEDRWQTANDLRQALKWIAEGGSSIGMPAAEPRRLSALRARALGIAAGVALVVASVTGAAWLISGWRATTVAHALVYRFEVSPPEHAAFSQSQASMVLSPDGHSLAFVASSPQSDYALWVRPLDSPARQLASEGVQPFWSPDSQSIACISGGKLERIDVASGLSQTLVDRAAQHSGAWSRYGVILFKSALAGPLSRIPSAGGPVTAATTLDESKGETGHYWPHFLPDGRHFLYVVKSSQAEHNGVVYVATLDSMDRRRLFTADSHAAYAAPGYLLFMRGNTLFAQRFDADRLQITGEPVPIEEQVDRNPGSRRGAFSASQTGAVLAFRRIGETQLNWFDRGGRRLEQVGPPAHYSSPALSPDGQQIAVSRLDPKTGTSDVWVLDASHGSSLRLTSDPLDEDMPLWSTDGRSILFVRAAPLDTRKAIGFYQKRSTGTSPEEQVASVGGFLSVPYGWSRDGQFLVYAALTHDSQTRVALWRLPRSGDRTPAPMCADNSKQWQGYPSPDGQWLAYVSDESGRNEVYVRQFPGCEGRRLVSVNGGIEPAWRRDGKELFYLAADRNLMAVEVRTTPTLYLGPPTRLFETTMTPVVNFAYTRNQYVVNADGQRFLINQRGGVDTPVPITVVVNWTERLKP